MRDRLLGFIDALRQAGIVSSPAETFDAANAVAAVGVERAALREALSATLVKDRTDRALFDELFDRYFALPARPRAKNQRREPTGAGAGQGSGEGGGGRRRREESAGEAGTEERERTSRRDDRSAARPAPKLSRRRVQMTQPFREMTPREVDDNRALVEELAARFRARCARRFERARGGRLDMRRTIRQAIPRGGVPIELRFRYPRPGKSDLLALVDLSHSTATAAEFLLALIVPARRFFRSARLFAYVDTPVEISHEHGYVVPHQPLDLAARSDFGAVLRSLIERQRLPVGRNTVLLILGDARNNRRPPRADLLAELKRRVRVVIWLNPEPPERWNTGDSVMAAYARYVDLLLPAYNLRTLAAALAALARSLA